MVYRFQIQGFIDSINKQLIIDTTQQHCKNIFNPIVFHNDYMLPRNFPGKIKTSIIHG